MTTLRLATLPLVSLALFAMGACDIVFIADATGGSGGTTAGSGETNGGATSTGGTSPGAGGSGMTTGPGGGPIVNSCASIGGTCGKRGLNACLDGAWANDAAYPCGGDQSCCVKGASACNQIGGECIPYKITADLFEKCLDTGGMYVSYPCGKRVRHGMLRVAPHAVRRRLLRAGRGALLRGIRDEVLGAGWMSSLASKRPVRKRRELQQHRYGVREETGDDVRLQRGLPLRLRLRLRNM